MTELQKTSAANAVPPSPQPRLLVIDDCEVHRQIICKLAAKAGFEPIEAESYADAVELMTYHDFEGVTLDLALGENAGTEVLRHCAERDFRSPIIILSGAKPDVARRAHDFGESLDLTMLEAVAKPVDLAELREQLSIIARTWKIMQRHAA
jgi:CheY-like chemotaxis protein